MKSIKFFLSSVAILAILFTTSVVKADIITPGGFTPFGTKSFGNLANATFGGNGIPKDAVQITTIGPLTLGLTATQRYGNPPLTNDGVGTFQALAGGDTLDNKPSYGMWNFDFYVSGVPQGETTKLWYDLNPAVGNNVSTFINFGNLNGQDSWNLGMSSFLGAGFDPTVAGQYDFKLAAYDSYGAEIGWSSIRVNVGDGVSSVPDGGTTSAMLGTGLVAMGLISYRGSRRSSTPFKGLAA